MTLLLGTHVLLWWLAEDDRKLSIPEDLTNDVLTMS